MSNLEAAGKRSLSAWPHEMLSWSCLMFVVNVDLSEIRAGVRTVTMWEPKEPHRATKSHIDPQRAT